jgi:hypothetical protein
MSTNILTSKYNIGNTGDISDRINSMTLDDLFIEIVELFKNKLKNEKVIIVINDVIISQIISKSTDDKKTRFVTLLNLFFGNTQTTGNGSITCGYINLNKLSELINNLNRRLKTISNFANECKPQSNNILNHFTANTDIYTKLKIILDEIDSLLNSGTSRPQANITDSSTSQKNVTPGNSITRPNSVSSATSRPNSVTSTSRPNSGTSGTSTSRPNSGTSGTQTTRANLGMSGTQTTKAKSAVTGHSVNKSKTVQPKQLKQLTPQTLTSLLAKTPITLCKIGDSIYRKYYLYEQYEQYKLKAIILIFDSNTTNNNTTPTYNILSADVHVFKINSTKTISSIYYKNIQYIPNNIQDDNILRIINNIIHSINNPESNITTTKQSGGNKKRTKELITYKNKEYSVYIGQRGGKYIKKNKNYINIKSKLKI